MVGLNETFNSIRLEVKKSDIYLFTGLFYSGAPGETRTHNHRIRSPVLCPIELQGHF